MTPAIIEVACCGLGSSPHQPRTPGEVAADALRCLAAGAAIVHTHVEDLSLTGAAAAACYLDGWRPVLDRHPEAILYGTSAIGDTARERCAHYGPLAAAGMRMGVLDPGSVNLGAQTAEGLPAEDPQLVYANSYADVACTIETLAAQRLGPSIAIYEPGWLRVTLAYSRAGRLPPGALVKLYFSDHNLFDGRPSDVTFGLQPTRAALEAYLELLEGSGLPWAVAVFGGDVVGSGLARLALERGGHLRVGLEDYRGPDSPTNEELVREAIALAGAVGRPVASARAAAELLGLPR